MKPFFVRTAGTSVEVWSGYHIQFDGEERHDWQKVLKAQLKELLSQFVIPVGAPLAGYYDTTDPRIADTENSLFTNWLTSMPAGINTLRFEHGTAAPQSRRSQLTCWADTSITTATKSAGVGPSGSQTRRWRAGTAFRDDCQTSKMRGPSGSRYAMVTRKSSSPSRQAAVSIPIRTSEFAL